MPSHPHSRASTAARSHIIETLLEDHRRLKRAYREFQHLDARRDATLCEALVRRTLQELRVHAQLEDELIYPLLRPLVGQPERVDAAEVEHEVIKLLVAQLEHAHGPADDKFAARFVVLCEYLLHHIKEEEGDLLPRLRRATLGWEGVCAEFTERREALLSAHVHSPPHATQGALLIDGADPHPAPHQAARQAATPPAQARGLPQRQPIH